MLSMIEFCNRRRMVVAIALLISLSVAVLFIESQWTPKNNHHPQEPSSENLTRLEDCYLREKYVILEECQPCSDIEVQSGSIESCKTAKYRQKIRCKKSGETYRKCDKVVWLEEKHFIFFELLMIALGVASGSFTFYRQRILDHKIFQRIQKQVASGV